MDDIRRVRQWSAVGMGIVGAIELLLLVTLVASGVNLPAFVAQHGAWAALPGFASLLSTLGLMLLFVIVLRLLQSVRTGRTPFALENVRRLKSIGVVLLVLGLFQLVGDLLMSGIVMVSGGNAVWMQAGQTVMKTSTNQVAFQYSTLVFWVTGLLVLCVAFVFQYGVMLQRQSDETL